MKPIKIDHRDIAVLPLPPHEDQVNGLYLDDQSLIHVSEDITAAHQAEILLHELIHAIWCGRGFAPRLTEEQVCTQLAPALATVLRDNAHLFVVLQQALHNDQPIIYPQEV